MALDETPSREPVPEQSFPPERLSPSASVPPPTPFADLPKPSRKGDSGVAVPFDPMGYAVLESLAEVQPKTGSDGGAPVTKAQIDAARRKARFVPKFPTLESMYAEYPRLLTSGKLRVVRETPQWVDDPYTGKTRVSGTLAFKHPCVTSEEFTRQFGGQKYRVFGLLEQEDPANSGGPPQLVEVAVAEFDLPLAPNLENLPVAEADIGSYGASDPPMPFPMYQSQQMFNPSPYGRRAGMPPQYPYYMPQQMPGMPGMAADTSPVFNFAKSVMEQQRAAAPPPMPEAFWNVLGRQGESGQENLRFMAEQQSRMAQAQIEALQQQLMQERQTAREQMSRPSDLVSTVEAVAKLTEAQKGGADSDVMRQLRDDHERNMRHAKEEADRAMARTVESHERELARLKEDYERLLVRERDSAEQRVKLAETRNDILERNLERRERELRDEGDKGVHRTREDMQRIMDSRDRDFQMQIMHLKDLHSREMSNLQSLQDREARMNESMRANTMQVTEQAHNIEMRSVRNDLAKLSGELAEKRAAVEAHQLEANKPLLEKVKEIQETTAALEALAGGKGGDDGPDEEKWYNGALVRDLAKVALGKGAEILPKLMKAAADAGGGKAGGSDEMPVMGMTSNHQLPPQSPVSRLPPRQRKKIMFADSEGPRMSDAYAGLPRPSHDPRDRGPKTGAPRPFYPDAPPGGFGDPESAHHPMQHPPQEAPPTQGFESYMGPAPSQQPQPEPRAPKAARRAVAAPPAEADAQPQSPEEDKDPWEAFSWMPMARAEAVQFVTQLEQAAQAKVPPNLLVDQFVAAYPMEVVSQVPAMIPIKRLIEAVRSSSATSSMMLATGGGRRFLADVWAELSKRVEEWKSSPKGDTAATVGESAATGKPMADPEEKS
jgi:hypothetical protein